jgi:hypothetical protein
MDCNPYNVHLPLTPPWNQQHQHAPLLLQRSPSKRYHLRSLQIRKKRSPHPRRSRPHPQFLLPPTNPHLTPHPKITPSIHKYSHERLNRIKLLILIIKEIHLLKNNQRPHHTIKNQNRLLRFQYHHQKTTQIQTRINLQKLINTQKYLPQNLHHVEISLISTQKQPKKNYHPPRPKNLNLRLTIPSCSLPLPRTP